MLSHSIARAQNERTFFGVCVGLLIDAQRVLVEFGCTALLGIGITPVVHLPTTAMLQCLLARRKAFQMSATSTAIQNAVAKNFFPNTK